MDVSIGLTEGEQPSNVASTTDMERERTINRDDTELDRTQPASQPQIAQPSERVQAEIWTTGSVRGGNGKYSEVV